MEEQPSQPARDGGRLDYEAQVVKARRVRVLPTAVVAAMLAILGGFGPLVGFFYSVTPDQDFGRLGILDPGVIIPALALSTIFTLLTIAAGIALWKRPSSTREFAFGLGLLIGLGIEVLAIAAMLAFIFVMNLVRP